MNTRHCHVTLTMINEPLIDTASIKQTGKETIAADTSSPTDQLPLQVGVALLQQSGWQKHTAIETIRQAQDILQQCGIALKITLGEYHVSDYLLDFHSLSSRTLTDQVALPRPTLFLVRNTRRVEAFGGEAFGNINTTTRPWLSNTAWLISEQEDPGIALAHELFHILTDSGEHTSQQGNLMNADTKPANTYLTEEQCQLARRSRLFHGQEVGK